MVAVTLNAFSSFLTRSLWPVIRTWLAIKLAEAVGLPLMTLMSWRLCIGVSPSGAPYPTATRMLAGLPRYTVGMMSDWHTALAKAIWSCNVICCCGCGWIGVSSLLIPWVPSRCCFPIRQ